MADLNLSATITAYTNGVGGAPTSPSNANDGNDGTAAGWGTGGVGGGSYPIRGIESDLGSPQWVDAFLMRTNSTNMTDMRYLIGGTMGVGSYGSRLQYYNGSTWVNIPGSVTADDGNSPGNWTFTFTAPIQAQRWRIELGGKQSNGIWGGAGVWKWHIEDGTAPVVPPVVADFVADVTEGDPSLEVEFTDLSDGDPDTWAWDFGDGDTSTSQNPTHTYVNPGLYTVTLTATNSVEDLEDTIVKSSYIHVFDDTMADFSADPLSGVAPLTVEFTDLSAGDIVSHLWDFGDGTTSTEISPVHTYTRLGQYTVTLTINDGETNEHSETKVAYVVVAAPPVLPNLRDRILLSIRASFNDEDLYNHALVIATGDKAQTRYGEASDTDPDSPTRIEAIGDRVYKLETDLITTQQTADKAAKKAFLDHCLVTEDISLEAICNPALEGNDVIGVQELEFSQIQRNFRVQSFTIPLSSSRQSLKLARVINLQTQTISVNDDIVKVGDASVAIRESQNSGVTVPMVEGVEDDDILLLWVALSKGSDGDYTYTVDGGGWTSIDGSNAKWKYKKVDGPIADNLSISWVGTRRGVAVLMAYRNVAWPNPIAQMRSRTDTGTTLTIPSLTFGSGEYHLIGAVWGNNGSANYDWPDNWTEQAEADTGDDAVGHVAISVADRPKVGANAPSDEVVASKSLGSITYQLALRKDIS